MQHSTRRRRMTLGYGSFKLRSLATPEKSKSSSTNLKTFNFSSHPRTWNISILNPLIFMRLRKKHEHHTRINLSLKVYFFTAKIWDVQSTSTRWWRYTTKENWGENEENEVRLSFHIVQQVCLIQISRKSKITRSYSIDYKWSPNNIFVSEQVKKRFALSLCIRLWPLWSREEKKNVASFN